MLGGWYCRTLANEQNSGAAQPDEQKDNHHMDPNEEDSGSDESIDQDEAQDGAKNAIDYKTQYRYLKRKFKFLIYENEFFQDALRINQRRLLKVSRDRAFLLDRLLQYEKPENTSSESEDTESSEDEATKDLKRRKAESSATNNSGSNTGEPIKRGRKKRLPNATVPPPIENKQNPTQGPTEKQLTAILRIENEGDTSAVVDGHMTAAEVERHLQSKRPALELMTERASATVPSEMFSNEPSLDSESNDHIIDGSSPSHVAAEECVPMEYTN